MVLLDADGKVAGRYNKQVLVPVGEAAVGVTLPWIGTWTIAAPVTRYDPGRSEQPMRVAGHGLSTMICYEDLLPSYVRGLVNHSGSELLVSASSDSWFEGEQARRLHFVLAALRAIEMRRYLLRASYDGMSGLVAPTGQIVGSLPNYIAASGVFEARWLSGKTVYLRLGDWPMLLFALTILLGAAFSRFRRG
jgi:apolipoprotein N-acyltransferase